MRNMSWERQLESMIDAGHLDDETTADLSIAYTTETGDGCFLENARCWSFLSSVIAPIQCRNPSAYFPWQFLRSGQNSRSTSGTGPWYESASYDSRFLPRVASCSCTGGSEQLWSFSGTRLDRMNGSKSASRSSEGGN